MRTTDQTEIGIFWGYDVARGLGDPPRLYNQIARVVATQENNTVGENARMFALINLAMADAGIVSWGVKYRDDFWRPIVAIRQGSTDGNPDTVADPTWGPLGAPKTNPQPGETNFTPPFPGTSPLWTESWGWKAMVPSKEIQGRRAFWSPAKTWSRWTLPVAAS